MVVNLTTRETTHGIYKNTAATSQAIKQIFYASKNWDSITDSQRESLEMIAVKLARILNGNAQYRDHWDDVVGYSQLASDSVKPTLPQIQGDIADAVTAFPSV